MEYFILKTKDRKRVYKFERLEEPIICCGNTYCYIETMIFDDIVVYQRLLEKCDIGDELDMVHKDVCIYDTTHRGIL